MWVCSLATVAYADDVDVELRAKVLAGAQPAIVLRVRRAVAAVEAELRGAAAPLRLVHGPARRGATVELPFAAPVGTTHYEGTLVVRFADGGEGNMPLAFSVEVVAPLEIMAPHDQLELDKAQLTLSLSRAAGRCEWRLALARGAKSGVARFAGEPPGTPLIVRWPQVDAASVREIALTCYDRDGFSRAITITPHAAPALEVPDEQVQPEAGSVGLRLSKPAAACAYEVTYERPPVVRGETDLAGAAAGSLLVVRWSPRPDDIALRIMLTCRDTQGGAATLTLYPWQLDIPHQDVVFATNRSDIAAAEAPKLEAALAPIAIAVRRYGAIIPITLYVIGHTDTVGSREHNLTLSLARARAIGAYLRAHGVNIPVQVTGVGEDSPAVATPDETDELRNRRAQYVLAVEPPLPASWHQL